jgi:hypothetical protein
MELTEIFWTIFVATTSALVFGLVKACLKSKCDEVSCCCIKIHRNIEAEEDEHKFDVEHNQNPVNQFDL